MQARGLHHKLPRLLVVVHASRVHVSERASAELREGILNHHRDTEGTENSQKKTSVSNSVLSVAPWFGPGGRAHPTSAIADLGEGQIQRGRYNDVDHG